MTAMGKKGKQESKPKAEEADTKSGKKNKKGKAEEPPKEEKSAQDKCTGRGKRYHSHPYVAIAVVHDTSSEYTLWIVVPLHAI